MDEDGNILKDAVEDAKTPESERGPVKIPGYRYTRMTMSDGITKYIYKKVSNNQTTPSTGNATSTNQSTPVETKKEENQLQLKRKIRIKKVTKKKHKQHLVTKRRKETYRNKERRKPATTQAQNKNQESNKEETQVTPSDKKEEKKPTETKKEETTTSNTKKMKKIKINKKLKIMDKLI